MNNEILKYVKKKRIKGKKLIKVLFPLLNGYFDYWPDNWRGYIDYKKKYRFKNVLNSYQLTMNYLK